MMKLKVKDMMLNTWLPLLATTPEIREKTKSVFKSFEQVRAAYACYPDLADCPDLSWPTGWPPHAMQLAQFLDDVIYSDMFDGRFKDVGFCSLGEFVGT